MPHREGFLISEAVRGEGATLHDADGERFVDELAPRDHVARAIFNLPSHSAELDMTHVDPDRFPNIVEALQTAGLDPTTAAHPDLPRQPLRDGRDRHRPRRRGASNVPRLYAVGECACTGLHGANRLASNSLSECFVFGRRAALEGPRRTRAQPAKPRSPPRSSPRAPRSATRSGGSPASSATPPSSTELTGSPYALARLVAVSAKAREETRGSHGRAEFPDADPSLDAHHTILDPDTETPRFEVWTAS